MINEDMNPFAQLIGTLLQSRTQAHIFHLQTNSYAEHMALNAYYDGIVPLIDGLVESYQGRYGKVSGYTMANELKEYTDHMGVVNYFTALDVFVDKIRTQLPQDSFLQNQYDTVTELIASTNYKLKMLS